MTNKNTKPTKKSQKKLVKNTATRRNLLIAIAALVGVASGILLLLFIFRPVAAPLIKPASVSQTIQSPAVDIKVVSVGKVPARELMSGQVIEGKQGLVVKLSVKNNTQDVQSFLPVNQVFIKGYGDTLYQMIPVSGVADPIAAGDVAPGATLEGDISFMINEGDTQLRLYIDTRWNDVTPFVVSI